MVGVSAQGLLDRLLPVAARGVIKAVYEVAPSVEDLLVEANVSASKLESSLGFSLCSGEDGVVASQRLMYACMLHLVVSEYCRKGPVTLVEINDLIAGLGGKRDEGVLREVLVGHEERRKRTFYDAVPQKNRLFSIAAPRTLDICSGKYHRVLFSANEGNYLRLLARGFVMFREDAKLLFQAYSPYLLKLQEVSSGMGFCGNAKHNFPGCVEEVIYGLVSREKAVSKRKLHLGIKTDYVNLFEFQEEMNAHLGIAGAEAHGEFTLHDAVMIYEKYSGDEVGLSALRAKLDAANMDLFAFIDALNAAVEGSPRREGCFQSLELPRRFGFMGDSPVIRSLVRPEYLRQRPFAH